MKPPGGRVRVFGPAYLDRVLLVDRPLHAPGSGRPIDRSVEAIRGLPATDPPSPPPDAIEIRGESGFLTIHGLPEEFPGPRGLVRLASGGPQLPDRGVRLTSWHEDLGGMGAGFAQALGGELVLCLGSEYDIISDVILRLLQDREIATRPCRLPGREADWTLLVTSGPFGDKLPIGFRGCLSGAPLFEPDGTPCDVLLVASLTNALAASALRTDPQAVRVCAPSMRNMLDQDPPLSSFVSAMDALCCNREEWRTLTDRDRVAEQLGLLMVTDGPRGSWVRYRRPDLCWSELHIPVFPRAHLPRDTNRAGESYASTFLRTLLGAGWVRGPLEDSLARQAAARAAAAAALQLDRVEFGFPTDREIDEALRIGIVREINHK